MATTSVSVSYRPVRIGFLIRNGSIDDFIKCCEINTLLWGGIYNPIIPVGKNDYLTKQLIHLFSVDILLSISKDSKIESVIKDYPYLKNPYHISKGIFYDDWHTRKKVVGYIDVIHLIDYYWDEEFKHAKDDHSNCTYISWDVDDPLAHLFTAMFGVYPKNIGLKINYTKAFKNGLRAKEVVIKDRLKADLSKRINPLKLTSSRLLNYREFGREDGLYIGDPKNFMDLLSFWNLRASGMETIFLPKNELERFKEFTTTFVSFLDECPSKHPNFEDWIGVYSLRDEKDSQRTILSNFKTKKKFIFSHLTDTIWNGLNIKPSLPEFKSKSMLALVEQQYGRYRVDVPLPEKPFSEDRKGSQSYVISFSLLTEFEYPGYTLKIPNLPGLNEFCGRQVSLHPWNLRVKHKAFGLIEHLDKGSISIYPIKITDILIKLFEHAGLKANVSPAGRLANLIITSMNGIEGCRVFKIKGVRKLLKEIDCGMNWIDAEKCIWYDNFRKSQGLYIESRKKKNLTPADTLNYLIKKKVLSPNPGRMYKLISKIRCKHKEFSCVNCGYKSSIPIGNFEFLWNCGFCGLEHYLPLFIRTNIRNDLKSWFIKKSGLFAKENNQEGAIPVILTLMQLNRLIEHGDDVKWVASFELKDGSKSCEIDFAMLNSEYRFDKQELQIAIGECKGNIEINDEDIDNLFYVKEKLEKYGLSCYLVFSKTADLFLPKEIERFKKLVFEKNTIPILFTNTELEPYEPYWFHPKEKTLPYKYAHSFHEIAENSKHIYLG